MNGKITITISGDARVGKSTLAAVIAHALTPVGCHVVVVDDGGGRPEHARKILRNRKVTIRTETLARVPFTSGPRLGMHLGRCAARDGTKSCDCGFL